MAFAIKNIFQRGATAEATVDSPTGSERPMTGGFSGTSPFASAAQPNGNGFNPGFGGALFKTLGSEPMDGQPVAARQGGSPFSPYSMADSTVLTVADLLPVLPPELARANGAMPDQPVALSPQVLEAAISSGQLAVPIFEVYRVCPAMFQTPVSPHDPRLVSLPRGKLPNLIASHTGALKPAGAEMSPFGALPQGSSPFAPALPDVSPAGMTSTQGLRPAGNLPPRRPPGMPPAIPTQADYMNGGPQATPLSLPNQEPQTFAPQAAASPFGTLHSPPPTTAAPGQPASLLFTSPQPPTDPELTAQPSQPLQPMASPFAAMGGSPFLMSQPAPTPSPFQPQIPAQASPFAAAASPFEMSLPPTPPDQPRLAPMPFAAPPSAPLMAGGSSFGMAQPGMQPIHQEISPFGAAQPMTPPSRPFAAATANEEMLQVSLAAVLRGNTVQDLGFDPNFIPAWINTKLPAAMVQPQLATGQVSLDLGTIIDGTEATFRSVIAHGRRGQMVRMKASEVFGSTPVSAAAPAFEPAPQPQPAPFAPSPALGSALPGLVQPLASISRPFNPPPVPQPAFEQPFFSPKPEGLDSHQLFGEQSFAAAPSRPMFSPISAGVQPLPEILSPVMPNPILETPFRDASRTPSTPLFKPAPPSPEPRTPAPAPATLSGSTMGLSAMSDSEQMLLRALLGHTGKLDTPQVVKLTAQLPGIIACVNVRKGQVQAQAEATKAAQEFREQAGEISRSMRTLAGVIGIDAETLSIAAGERTITFCFQPDNAFGVLHQDNEPASGLREKITLIGREIAKLPA